MRSSRRGVRSYLVLNNYSTSRVTRCVRREQYGFWPAHRLKDITAEKYIGWQTYALEHKSMVLERIALGERELF